MIVKILVYTAIIALALGLFPLILMLLWNALMPEIFGLISINYWQAFGLNIISWILFRNIPMTNKKD